MVVMRLGSAEEMITDTLESLQLTQGFKHKPSVPLINTEVNRQWTHLNILAIPYATHTQT